MFVQRTLEFTKSRNCISRVRLRMQYIKQRNRVTNIRMPARLIIEDDCIGTPRQFDKRPTAIINRRG